MGRRIMSGVAGGSGLGALNIISSTITSTTSNDNIEIEPNGTGDVYLTADTVRIGDLNTNVTLTTNGTGDLTLSTNNGTNSGTITIFDAANGNIRFVPNGTGVIQLGTATNTNVTISGTTASTSKTSGSLQVAGGVGVSGAFYGAALNADGLVRFTNTTSSTNTSSGALVVSGGLGVGGALFVNSASSFGSTVAVGTPTQDSHATTKVYVDTKVGGSWSVKTSAYTIVSGDAIATDSTSAAFTLTLPSSPSTNAYVLICDISGQWGTNNVTVARNGQNIMGAPEDLVLDIANDSIRLTYINSTYGWRLT